MYDVRFAEEHEIELKNSPLLHGATYHCSYRVTAGSLLLESLKSSDEDGA